MSSGLSSLWTRHWVNGTALTRIIAVNLLVWLAVILLSVVGKFFFPVLQKFSDGVFYLATWADVQYLLRRPWTVITHMFTHVGVLHILVNMWLLYLMGSIFQGNLGQRKLLSTYLMGGLVGFLAFFILYNGSGALDATGKSAIGASASVMAIFVATATYFPDMEFRLLLIGNVKLKYLALVYVLLDFVALNGMSNVGGHAGHLGGALYGFLLVTQWRKGRDLNAGMEWLLDRLTLLVRPAERKLRVAHKRSTAAATAKRKTDEEFNRQKKERQERIDRILDKISRAGYDSLTSDEKDYLFRHGKDI
jgi:membrane associated rhomboid family serine protease